jgi:hypothetical protein
MNSGAGGDTSRETGTCATAGFPDLSVGQGDQAYHLSRDTNAGNVKASLTTSGAQSRFGNIYPINSGQGGITSH